MRLSILAASVLALGLAGCVIVVPENGKAYTWNSSSNTVQGNGSVSTDTRAVSTAAVLEVDSRRRVDMEIDVRVGPATSLQIEGDSNLLPLVHTDSSNGKLRIWVEDELRANQPLRVRYTTPQLTRLEASGPLRTRVSGLDGGNLAVTQNGSGRVDLSGRVNQLDVINSGSGSLQAEGLESAQTRVTVHGSGSVKLGQVRGEQMMAKVHGSGSLSASGNVRSLDVAVFGSGGARLSGLRSETADLSANGSGGISAAVSQSVQTSTNGSGGITVYGNPPQRNVFGKRTTFVQ